MRGDFVDLQGKIELLDDMIAGRIPAEEYPLEFQGMSASALIQLRDLLVEENRDGGITGEASEKARQEKENYHLHMAGHARIEIEEAMALHHDFIQHGMFEREKLETFGALLDNDAYWRFLQENEEERNKVREQHFQGMMAAIEDGERSVLDMSEREAELQGEGNMYFLIGKEREVIRQNATDAGKTAEEAEAEVEAYDQAVKAKHGHTISADERSFDNRLGSQYRQEVSREGSEQAQEYSTGTVAVAKNEADLGEAIAFFGDPSKDQEFDRIAKQNPEAVKTWANGVQRPQEVAQETTESVADASKPLREQAASGVEESGKSEPDAVVVENTSKKSQDQGAILGG